VKAKRECDEKGAEYVEFKAQQAKVNEALSTGQAELEVQEQLVASMAKDGGQ